MLRMKRSSWQRRKLRSSSSSSMRFCSQAFFSRATYRWARRLDTRMNGLNWEWGGSCTTGSGTTGDIFHSYKHITNIYSWHFIQDHRTHRSVQLQSWIFWTQLQDNGDHRWSCVVHAAYRLSSAGLGSGGSWVVFQCSPPGETTPHRHLDTSVLLLLLLVLPMMKMPELHSLLLKSEIWNITSQRPLTVF